jgi:hypothetical protein
MRAQGEREGEGARLRAQMSRGKWVSGVRALKGVRACGGGRETRGYGRVHGGSAREVRDGDLTGGVHGAARGDMRMHEKKRRRQIGPTGSERERERGVRRTRERGQSLAGAVHLSGDAGARAA